MALTSTRGVAAEFQIPFDSADQSASGTLEPMVEFMQVNKALSTVESKGVSGALISSVNVAVLVYPSKANATVLAR